MSKLQAFLLLLALAVIIYFLQGQTNVVEYVAVVKPHSATTVYIPIAVDENGNVHEVMHMINCSSCSFEISDSEYGKILKVTTDSEAVIKGEYSHPAPILSPSDKIKPSTLTNHSDFRGKVYIYSSGEAELRILIESRSNGILSRHLWSSFHWEVGWIKLERGWRAYNCIKSPGRVIDDSKREEPILA